MEEIKLIIENCEKQLSEWLFLEYSHSIQIWENIVFTNIPKHFEKLKEIAHTEEKSFSEFLKENHEKLFINKENIATKSKNSKEISEYNKKTFSKIFNGKTIVLDPFAKKELKTNDFKNCDFIVVGGILGDKKFTGKTKKLISDKLNCEKRNLGKIQLPIDISVFVAKLIYLGKKLKEIEITNEVEIFLSENHTITLPYGYPIINGKILITPKLVEYLRKRF